jgi:CRISPR-associated protein Csx10
MRMHAVVDDVSGRPQTSTGGPFTYVAIKPGTLFRAEVWAETGTQIRRDALTGRQRIGASRKDDYGLVRIRVVDPPKLEDEHKALRKGEVFTALAVTDLVLTGSRGQADPSMDAWARELSAVLGTQVTPYEETPEAAGDEVKDGPWLKYVRYEGWQRSWGLGRPSIVGIARGSVAEFRAGGEVAAESIESLVATGVGVRRAEGFGRVVVNPRQLSGANLRMSLFPGADEPADASEAVLEPEPQGTRPPPAEPDSTTGRLIYAAWVDAVRAAALRAAEKSEVRVKYLPASATRSQLGTLRALAMGLEAEHAGPPPGATARIVGVRDAQKWIQGVRDAGKDKWTPASLNALMALFPTANEAWGTTDPTHPIHPIWRVLFGNQSEVPQRAAERLGQFNFARVTAAAVKGFLVGAVRAAQAEGDRA